MKRPLLLAAVCLWLVATLWLPVIVEQVVSTVLGVGLAAYFMALWWRQRKARRATAEAVVNFRVVGVDKASEQLERIRKAAEEAGRRRKP